MRSLTTGCLAFLVSWTAGHAPLAQSQRRPVAPTPPRSTEHVGPDLGQAVLKGPAWTVESDQVGAGLGNSVASAGDVNGDGYCDLIVGAYAFDNGQTHEGRAYLFLGSATGPAATPSWTAEGDASSAIFGSSVATAGDVNGDGFSDVIIGAYTFSNGQAGEGRAYVYHGSATGLASDPAWTAEGDQANAEFGYSVATAGDVNGDGYSDVVVGAVTHVNGQVAGGRAYLFLGSAGGLAASPSWTAEGDRQSAFLGSSVATAGDVNGDGYDDLLVGARGYTDDEEEEGRVYLYLGSAAGLPAAPAWIAEGDREDAYLGYSVSTAGDVNGDGFADVVVGAYGYSDTDTYEGQARLHLGSAAGLSATPDWTAEGDVASAFLGFPVATAGDVNGDGYGDVIVGAYGYTDPQISEGRALAYLGSPAGLATAPAWSAESNQRGAIFGFSLATAGDVNGDGYSDVVIGAPGFDGGERDEGSAYSYFGSATGLASTPAWTAESDQRSSGFAGSVASAGDVNGDGYGDVIVGASAFDDEQVNEGRAHVYLGTPAGLQPGPAWTGESNQESTSYGASVASAGDVNGDGYGDVVVGAYLHSDGVHLGGRAYVYHGSKDGLATRPAWIAHGEVVNAILGYSVASAGDVNGDGFGDVIVGAPQHTGELPNAGRATVHLGSAAGLAPAPVWSADGEEPASFFGGSVASAGDVNGDGYGDVIVGASGFDGGQAAEGLAVVYLGSASGPATRPAWSVEGDQPGARLGNSVASAGDVDGDGYSDVLVGAIGFTNGENSEGRAALYLGSATGLSTSPDWVVEGEQALAFLGTVASAGDVNGDGYSDVIVGAYGFTAGQTREGGAFLYLGSAAGLSTSPAWSGGADQAQASFGFALGTAGDVNGDGYGDVIVGALLFDAPERDEGRAFVYLGNEGGGSWMRSLQQLRPSGSQPIPLLGLTAADGLFRIRAEFQRNLSTFVWAWPAPPRAVLEWEVKPAGVPFDGNDVERSAVPVPLLPAGGTVTFDELALADVLLPHLQLAEGTTFHWRARVATDNPLFPHTAWFSQVGNNITEAKLRRPGRSLR